MLKCYVKDNIQYFFKIFVNVESNVTSAIKKSLHSMFTLFTPLKSFFHLLPHFEQLLLLISIFPLRQTYVNIRMQKRRTIKPSFKIFYFANSGRYISRIVYTRYAITAIHIDSVPYAYSPVFHPWLPKLFFSLYPAQCNFWIRSTTYKIYRKMSL